MKNSEFEEGLEGLFSRVVGGDASLGTDVRLAIANGENVPEDYRGLTEKVHKHAYKVTDDDIQALLESGHHEEDVFEAIVSGAVGAAVGRWRKFCAEKPEDL